LPGGLPKSSPDKISLGPATDFTHAIFTIYVLCSYILYHMILAVKYEIIFTSENKELEKGSFLHIFL
jgi:hypothetical protein